MSAARPGGECRKGESGMKHVLLVCTPPMDLSGVASVIRNYLSVPGPQIRYEFVFCASSEEAVRRELSKVGPIHTPPVGRLKHPFSYSRWLMRFLRAGEYDAVHVHGNSGTMYFDIHAAKKAGVPIRIVHCHSSSCTYRMAHRVLKPLLNRELTHAVACSAPAGKWLFTGPFTWLPNGIDTDRFRFSVGMREEARAALGLENAFVIGHVGQFLPVKNQEFLLEAFARVYRERQDAVLLLVGDGPLREKLRERAKELGLSHAVRLPGARADIERFYAAMDVFAMPSLFEGLPVTLVEAQASGLPCIISQAVTREADLTGRAVYLPIGAQDTERWAAALAAAQPEADRVRAGAPVEESLFNIRRSAGMLWQLYGAGDGQIS